MQVVVEVVLVFKDSQVQEEMVDLEEEEQDMVILDGEHLERHLHLLVLVNLAKVAELVVETLTYLVV
jgi:hypothetical protein